MSENKLPISVIIHTKNAAATIEKCLHSVLFAQEILVIDMESSDETEKIAKKNGAQFITVKDKGYGYADPVRNFGLQQATQPWILVVDSDEEVSTGLSKWINNSLSKENTQQLAAAYRIPRRNFIFGQEIKHTGWWPDYQVRFFQKGSVTWPVEVHGVPEVNGKVEDLPANRELAFIHDNYPTVEKFVERMNRYTSATAKENHGKESKVDFSEKKVVETFSQEFIRRMFQWEGYKDHGVGMSLSFLQATYELLVLLKRAEKEGLDSPSPQPWEALDALYEFSSEIRYWYFESKIKESSGISQLLWRIRRKLVG